MQNCDYIKRYGTCSSSCRRHNVSCEPLRQRKDTVLDYAIEYVIAAACLIGAGLVVLL